MFRAHNGTLEIGNATMDYIRFGAGERTLIMLPGLGDGLRTVKGTALPMAAMYRMFSKEFTVYAFSRKNGLPRGYTTRDMAGDVADAMDRLGIGKADIFGVSMGGMIAQHLAIDHPERVERLILAVTCAQPNPILNESVSEWVELAKRGDHAGFMDSNLRRIYSDAYYRKNKWMAPVVGALTKPKSYDRFFLLADACLNHNALESLHRIRSRTLVIGGEQDKALGADPSREIAAAIPGSRLKMYAQWGHGVYEEAEDFNAMVLDFLTGRET
jgi:pimeloyl-ACP methyl ester carboxylesterase